MSIDSTSPQSTARTSPRDYWNAELETLPWLEVERWQATQLGAMLPALRLRSALYARLHANAAYAHLNELTGLQALPFTTKDDLRTAQQNASAQLPFGSNQCAATQDIVQVLSSSGTTGTPLYYAMTQADVDRFSDAVANTWHTAGLRRNDVVAHLVGLPMVAGGLSYADGFRRVGATLCWLGGFPTDRIVREMRRLRVTAMLATTSFGLYLAEHWDNAGAETGVPSALKKMLGGGEPGLNQPDIRAQITNGLGISHLRDSMGLGDVIPSMWSECEAQDGMHFNAQKYVAIELIDPQSGANLPWREGERGEIVYTALARDATPVVRYRSRDHALVTGVNGCACGRTSPRIHCIGRTDDMLIYKGMNVFPTAIRDLVLQAFSGRIGTGLRIWKTHKEQVRFDEAIPLEIEAGADLPSALYVQLASDIEALVRGQLQVRVQVKVIAPGGIPRGVYKNALLVIRDAT